MPFQRSRARQVLWSVSGALGTAWLATVNVTGLPAQVDAHGGGLDRFGCHNDRKNGGYHCHRAPAPPLPATATPPTPAPLAQPPATVLSTSDEIVELVVNARLDQPNSVTLVLVSGSTIHVTPADLVSYSRETGRARIAVTQRSIAGAVVTLRLSSGFAVRLQARDMAGTPTARASALNVDREAERGAAQVTPAPTTSITTQLTLKTTGREIVSGDYTTIFLESGQAIVVKTSDIVGNSSSEVTR